MKSSFEILLLLLVPVAILPGCIGTDFLEEATDLVEPRIEIFPEVSAVQIGEAIAFQAMYYDSTDAPVTTNFQWMSSDTGVADISEAGNVTGVTSGQARITASAYGISSEQALLTVVLGPNQVAFVEIAPMDTSIIVRNVMQFSALTLNATRMNLDNRLVTWRTDNDTLATIDEQGLVTTLKPGIVKIIAESEGIESGPVNLEIFAESRTGGFRARAGTSYTVKGTAILEQIPGSAIQLRFAADFQSSNGPDLNVYLSTDDSINSASIKLGQLKSTRGAQVYEVPGFVEMNDFDHVIIHCLPFNVTFGSAPLR